MLSEMEAARARFWASIWAVLSAKAGAEKDIKRLIIKAIRMAFFLYQRLGLVLASHQSV